MTTDALPVRRAALAMLVAGLLLLVAAAIALALRPQQAEVRIDIRPAAVPHAAPGRG